MTATEKYLNELDESKRSLFSPLFDSPEQFYAIAYLIAKNEHMCSLEKSDHREQRLEIIHQVQSALKEHLRSLSFDGENLMADISSDYFEDFVAYKDRQFDITNEEFLSKIKAIQQL